MKEVTKCKTHFKIFTYHFLHRAESCEGWRSTVPFSLLNQSQKIKKKRYYICKNFKITAIKKQTYKIWDFMLVDIHFLWLRLLYISLFILGHEAIFVGNISLRTRCPSVVYKKTCIYLSRCILWARTSLNLVFATSSTLEGSKNPVTVICSSE